jgi:hypothetical protein
MDKNLVKGFVLLPIGLLLTPFLPEFGVPIILLSTRYLREKYAWADRLNVWVESKYRVLKDWLRKIIKKLKSRPISCSNCLIVQTFTPKSK